MNAPTILVPLDGTSNAVAALPVARRFAELEGATLHIVHIGEPTASPNAVLEALGLTPEQLHGCVLDNAAGPPAVRILQLANEHRAILMVLCTHTAAAKARGALGGVAQAVLRDAPCPIVLVHPDRGLKPWAVRAILLPHDGTPTTAAAISPAAALAIRADAELSVLHIAEPQAQRSTEPGTFVTPRYVDQPQHEWPSWAREFLQRLAVLGHCPAAARLRLILDTGDPGTEIVRVVEKHGCDLVVLGWRGSMEAEHAATMRTVIRDCGCPVFIVRVDV